MDQLTHTVRRSNWINIIRQCQDRPAGTTAKQWLAENDISEIINGERKSEIMEKEVKKVVEAMSDYATAEKAIVLKRVKAASIIGLVALIIGLIMESICYDSMIPIYESIKGICLGLNSCYPIIRGSVNYSV